ncbi:DoxX family protein [Thalassotalea euphylliae]|uniref:DoxX family protein n=1 Tax=Thalassotalea euphylliae TaxID=1655234 RepID=UPI0036433257
MISKLYPLRDYYNLTFGLFDYLKAPALLFARLYIGWVFFKSGLTKIDDWESTLMLFEYEYMVPVLSFESAAYLATIGELVLPILLFVGLGTRFAASGITVINIVAVIAYVDISVASLNMHIVWGLGLLALMILGGGYLSLDKKLKVS